MDLVKQTHWDKNYEKSIVVPKIPSDSPIMEWIHTYLSDKGNNCIEIGVFPGGYINEFGKLGYEISGIDLTPRVVELDDIFRSRNYSVGQFWQQDFFELKSEKKYDIVYSMGFIEHFTDYKKVIAKHCDLVADNGIVFIVVPNFKGKVQYYLHRILDNKNLKRHNLESMNPKDWEDVLIENNFEIIKQGFMGKFYFWTGIRTKYVRHAIRLFLNYIVNPVVSKFLSKPSQSHSPFCGIIAKKKV